MGIAQDRITVFIVGFLDMFELKVDGIKAKGSSLLMENGSSGGSDIDLLNLLVKLNINS